MAICPADLKPCIDDLCYGGGCLQCGEELLTECQGCGQLVGINGGSRDDCECEPDDYDDEPFDEDPT